MSTLRQLIEQKIKDSSIEFNEVAGSADLAAIMSNRFTAPACYLFRQKNHAGENESVSSVIQEVNQTISIIVITKNVRDAKGADSSDENEALCEQIQSLLLNWKPSVDYKPIIYGGGSLITFRDGFFVWQESYKTNKTICV